MRKYYNFFYIFLNIGLFRLCDLKIYLKDNITHQKYHDNIKILMQYKKLYLCKIIFVNDVWRQIFPYIDNF